MKRYINLVFLLMLSCVEPYDYNSSAYEKVLVVEGTITDEEGPYTVAISYTYALDSTTSELVTDATVWVTDSNGNRTDYTYSEDDGYYESPSTFVGSANETYQLHIEMSDGSLYASSEQTLLAAPPIDSLYGIYAKEASSNDAATYVGGIQFFIDTHDDTGTAKYFRFEYDEAYKIIVPYPSSYDIEEDGTIVLLDTSKGICYQEDVSNTLIYGTTETSTGNQLLEFPVRWVSEETQMLRVRYTIQVHEHAISEEAYLYYKALDESNSGGSLFDQQTGSVYGNIYSETNSDEDVLGFFEASGVSKMRRFYNKSDLDDRLNVADFLYTCSDDYEVDTTTDSAVYYSDLGYEMFGYLDDDTIEMQTRGCTDCSFYANTTPPDYWID